ncbi:hypothetical protein TURU_115094 [Turdus rufiventris]|nr:hypothetical protein TURU_115094 [Turdus rufiventris]
MHLRINDLINDQQESSSICYSIPKPISDSDTLEGRDAIQRDLDKLKRSAIERITSVNRDSLSTPTENHSTRLNLRGRRLESFLNAHLAPECNLIFDER